MSAHRLLQHLRRGSARLFVMALVLMLSLSPFLHAHLGSSAVTGFHLDLPAGPPQGEAAPSGGSAAHAVASVGVTRLPAGPPQGEAAPSGGSAAHAVASVGAIHHESPAVGVAHAYPSPSGDWQAADVGAFFMLVLFLASLLPLRAMDRVRARAQPATLWACYRPGCPPPAMAPPPVGY